jgi:hypothetical protein
MDTKKKELIGNFYRDGQLLTTDKINVNDHDFASLADGIAIPHGIYDIGLNIGYVTIGTSHDTSEFACDCILNWWQNHGQFNYPNATSILFLCDCGGSNNARYYIFKDQLQKLSDTIGIEIRIAHYPPYTSKYNPIEHRLFPHVTRACKGIIFKNLQIVKDVIGKAKTKKGLKVFTAIHDKLYETGKKLQEDFKETMKIIFDGYLPKWNYRVVPCTL